MSKDVARRALRQLSDRPSLMAPEAGAPMETSSGGVETVSTQFVMDLRELAAMSTDATELAAIWQARKEGIAADYWGDSAPSQSKPFAFSEGTAVIPVHGSLINRYSWSSSWATGYNFIRSQLTAANADPDVKRIVLDVDSYGGTVSGCQETGEAIAKSDKPIMAMVDDSCFSAAYWLASQADQLNVTPTGRVGSIGVVMMHVDMSKALDNYGVKVTFLYAGSHKIDGNPVQPLSRDAKERFQAEIDACYDLFCAAVAEGRGLPDKKVRGTEALTYRAEDALKIGLIDGIKDMNAAVAAFVSGEEDDPQHDDDQPEAQENDMAVKPNASGGEQPSNETTAALTEAQLAEASKTGADAAKARIAAILTHPEAQGRGALANHLAFETDMSADAAGKLLAVSAKEGTAAPPPNKEEPSAEESRFRRAMGSAEHPEVGAGATGATGANGEQAEDRGLAVLASYRKFTGTAEKKTA